jgi:acyl carrier protein
MSALDLAREILRSNLQLGPRADQLRPEMALMGAFPEFNSLTVVGLISAIEEQLSCQVADDEISADVFTTVGTFANFIALKME